MTNNPNQLLRIKDLVLLLSISESTIRRYVKDGILPAPAKLTPRVVVWEQMDITTYIIIKPIIIHYFIILL
jgi:predicted DNA-binding transcriptional regulator AlpA